MKLLIIFALCVATSNAGFCDDQSSGYHCDGDVRKYCRCNLDCDRRRMSAEDTSEMEEIIAEDNMNKQEAADTDAFLELLENEPATTDTKGRTLKKKSRYRFYRSIVSRRFSRSRSSVSCKWKCEKQNEETCSLGCRSGACKTADKVCGSSTSSKFGYAPDSTCQTAFSATSVEGVEEKNECETSTNTNNKICALNDATWGLPTNFVPWKDKQDSATKMKDAVTNAAADAQWFDDVLFRRMYLPLNIEDITSNATHPMYANKTVIEARLTKVMKELRTYYTSQKQNFISFSCLRNIAQCKGGENGQGDQAACKTQCNKVSLSVKGFNTKCNALAAANATSQFLGAEKADGSNQLFECRPLGAIVGGEYMTYERDCDGTNPEAEYPALCAVFQNDYVPRTTGGDGSGAATNAPFLGFVTVIAFFLSR